MIRRLLCWLGYHKPVRIEKKYLIWTMCEGCHAGEIAYVRAMSDDPWVSVNP